MPNSDLQFSTSERRLIDCLDPVEESEITPIHSKPGTRISRVKVIKDWRREPADLEPTCREGSFVAKKLMRTTDKEEWKRVCREEFNILSRCECQHIVAAFEVSLDFSVEDPNSFPFYLMELAECSLHYVLTTKLPDTGEFLFPTGDDEHCYTYQHCLSWLRQIAHGMEYLHKQKIIHRDLKSLNVLMFNSRTRCKLCDFDMSRIVDPCGMTPEKGTWRWMAPELRRRCDSKTVTYDTSVDSYSFGILVCESLLRETPFKGYSDEAFSMANEAIPQVPFGEVAMEISKDEEVLKVVVKREKFVFEVNDRLWKQLNLLLTWDKPENRPKFTTVISIFDSLKAKQVPLQLMPSSNNSKTPTDTRLLAGESVRSFDDQFRVSVVYRVTVADGDSRHLKDEQKSRIKDVLQTFAKNVCVKAAKANKEEEEELKDVKVTFEIAFDDDHEAELLHLGISGGRKEVEKVKVYCSNASHMIWMASLFESDDEASLRSVGFALEQ